LVGGGGATFTAAAVIVEASLSCSERFDVFSDPLVGNDATYGSKTDGMKGALEGVSSIS
jgi:hypothetical protein